MFRMENMKYKLMIGKENMETEFISFNLHYRKTNFEVLPFPQYKILF